MLILLFLLFFPIPQAHAVSPDIVINEIAWSGTSASSSDEWIELKNNTSAEIDLTGWFIVSQDETPKIQLSGTITSQGFFLLERTDDETVSNITADLIYTGALEDSGEVLELKNPDGTVIDKIDCPSQWFAGDKDEKASMSRKNSQALSTSDNWFTATSSPNNAKDAKNQLILGSPKAQNETYNPFQAGNTDGDEDGEEENPEETTSNTENSGKILINEIMPNPQTNQKEWIELFNLENFDLALTGWTLTDGRPQNLANLSGSILKNSFLLVELTQNKLNNDGDLAVLKNSQNEIIDQMAYGKWDDGNRDDNAPLPDKGFSLARIGESQDTNIDKNDFMIAKNPTPGAKNNLEPIDATTAVASTNSNPPADQPIKKETNNSAIENTVQGISKSQPENSQNSDLPRTGGIFFVLFILILCAGLVVL